MINMKAHFLLFEGFSGFEFICPAFTLRNVEKVTIGLSKNPILSEERIKFFADIIVDDVNADDIEILIIPGGNALQHLKDGSKIQELLEKLHGKNRIIAAVCGGPVLLANTDILEGKKFTAGGGELPENWQKNFTKGQYVKDELAVDGNIITAKAVALAKFAIAIGKKLNLFKNKEEEDREYHMLSL
ncbi:MAG: DJ-1/PfpI family protein [Asgard group archaeon]|nr:DJ-1/PfpI family protein [Asgard group archaeon]